MHFASSNGRCGEMSTAEPMSLMGFLNSYWKHGTTNTKESLTFEMKVDGDKVLWVRGQQQPATGPARRALGNSDPSIANAVPDDQPIPPERSPYNNHKKDMRSEYEGGSEAQHGRRAADGVFSSPLPDSTAGTAMLKRDSVGSLDTVSTPS